MDLSPDHIPSDYSPIKVVGSLSELFGQPYGSEEELAKAGIECVLYPRSLRGDFNALAAALDKVTPLYMVYKTLVKDNPQLLAIASQPTAMGDAARAVLADIEIIEKYKSKTFNPYIQIRIVPAEGYQPIRPEESPYLFHRDDGYRLYCCYNGSVTEHIREASFRPFKNGDIWVQTPAFEHRARPVKPGDGPRLALSGDL